MDDNPQFASQVLRLQAGIYTFWSKETVINLRQVREVPREKLKERILSGELTFEGMLNQHHLDQIDKILAASPVVERRLKKRVAPQPSS